MQFSKATLNPGEEKISFQGGETGGGNTGYNWSLNNEAQPTCPVREISPHFPSLHQPLN